MECVESVEVVGHTWFLVRNFDFLEKEFQLCKESNSFESIGSIHLEVSSTDIFQQRLKVGEIFGPTDKFGSVPVE